MSHYKTFGQVTSIDSLPELDDLENGSGFQNQVNNKYIRNESRNYPMESGMNMQPTMSQQPNIMQPPPQVQHPTPVHEVKSITTFDMPSNTPTCLDIAEHIANCPICSKFYNNDKTLYIVAIVVLSIICVILLKKVLDK
jgi:hypothetical protein